MNAAKKVIPNRSKAREFAMQFLYQCERRKVFFYSDSGCLSFSKSFGVPEESDAYLRHLSKGILGHLSEIDQLIAEVSENWSVSRMGSVDRCVLRIGVFELMCKEVPYKVIINEAVELGKQYGTENSGRFINGVLDKVASRIAGA